MTRTEVARGEALRALEDELEVLVRRLKRTIAERAHALHPSVQGSSYLVLGWLADRGPARLSTVVDVFGTDKGAMSRQVQHLEELGLVERTPDPTDGRASLVSATPAALSRLASLEQDRRDQLEEQLADWSADELTQLTVQLGRYNRSLD